MSDETEESKKDTSNAALHKMIIELQDAVAILTHAVQRLRSEIKDMRLD